MNIIYKTIFILGSLLSQVFTLPIYAPHNNQIHLDPAIVVTRPTNHPSSDPILYEPLELSPVVVQPSDPILYEPLELSPVVVPQSPEGTRKLLENFQPRKVILSDGSIIYTPKDIKPFMISPFTGFEPL